MKTHGDSIFVITDQTMPDVTGVTLAEKLLAGTQGDVYNSLHGVQWSRYQPTRQKKPAYVAFVMKPVVKKELAETVRATEREQAGSQ